MHKAAQKLKSFARRMASDEKLRRRLAGVLALLCVGLVCLALFAFPTGGNNEAPTPQETPPIPQKPPSTTESATSLPVSVPQVEPAIVQVPQDAGGYPVVGLLTIPVLDMEWPVIAEVGSAALKVAPCLYAGPSSPQFAGNIVITGHNYEDGTHFSRLEELEDGDTVLLAGSDGVQYAYEVYDRETIAPDDIPALEDYEGEYGLALITCAQNGKNRLLVRCMRVEG